MAELRACRRATDPGRRRHRLPAEVALETNGFGPAYAQSTLYLTDALLVACPVDAGAATVEGKASAGPSGNA